MKTIKATFTGKNLVRYNKGEAYILSVIATKDWPIMVKKEGGLSWIPYEFLTNQSFPS